MICTLCQRDVQHTTTHHLIPRTRHKNKRNKREFSREEVKTRTVDLCGPCHDFIHKQFAEKTLERELNTIERLRKDPDVAKFIEWIASKPDGFTVPHAKSGKGKR